MEDFFSAETGFGESIWPKHMRQSFCYAPRQGGAEKLGCNAKNGNPFGPFWDTFGVDFVGSVTYGPLHYDVRNTDVAEEWNKKYPADQWPVLAFVGAPAPFPVQKDNLVLQKYFVWNTEMQEETDKFIQDNFNNEPFIGIHLRNGVDWVSEDISLLKLLL